ncbi:peptidase M19 [Sphingomonas sp. So64.6b]|uniref:membrane dipeptidase n=1 Tax=Sphingomonas sp. So64.6b TaxID=2997354 RepID=UPI001601D9AF|nr:membrane dipeptidase [Sphingomonas sp. So64.6b]QNA86318.1 peptidase M19 [Sphingomonas sp. So64.6b]
MDIEALHAESIIIDAVCPITYEKQYVDWYREGGVTVVTPTLAWVQNADFAFKAIASWHAYIAGRSDTRLIRSAADIRAVKQAGQTGIMLHFQGADPIEDNLELVPLYGDLGIKVIQLCYNRRNRVGDGGSERTDSGLSYFGQDLVAALNKARIVVDCAHTGPRTTLEAIEASTSPVVISHGNSATIHPSARNVTDDVIKAIGGNGGMVGVVGFPAFVNDASRPTLDHFIDHIVHIAGLIGIDNVGLGIDYASMQWPIMSDEAAVAIYDQAIAAGIWRADTYPKPPYYYPEGIETPRTMINLTRRLVERDFDAESIRKILGGNWMRLYETVWGD